MKLYTEFEVRSLLNDLMLLESSVDDAIDSLTPIELPSDEEIETYVKSHYYDDIYENLIEIGAKWVIEQIKQQDDTRR